MSIDFYITIPRLWDGAAGELNTIIIRVRQERYQLRAPTREDAKDFQQGLARTQLIGLPVSTLAVSSAFLEVVCNLFLALVRG